ARPGRRRLRRGGRDPRAPDVTHRPTGARLQGTARSRRRSLHSGGGLRLGRSAHAGLLSPPAHVVPARSPDHLAGHRGRSSRSCARPPGKLVSVTLEKYQALGNDFLIVVDPDARKPLDVEWVRRVCDRGTGVGADGVIRVTPGREGADLTMELRNADGGRAEMS